jgi:hypothetical protein
MAGSTRSLIAGVLAALALAVICFGAPALPAIIGALVAAGVIYWRAR